MSVDEQNTPGELPNTPVDGSAESEARGYRVAGLVYLVLGTMVLLVTVASPADRCSPGSASVKVGPESQAANRAIRGKVGSR